MIAALSVADATVLVTSAAGAVQVGAEKAIEYCSENDIPLIIWVNGVNKENTSFENTLKHTKKCMVIKLLQSSSNYEWNRYARLCRNISKKSIRLKWKRKRKSSISSRTC